MTREIRSFTPEFKLEAASLVVDQNYSLPEACRALDMGESALRRWVKQLEARVKRLEQEKFILKKATALLMSDSLSNSR